MGPVLQVDGDLDHIETHVDDVAAGGAVVACPRVALEGAVEVAAVEEVVSEVVVAAPDALLDRVRLVIFQVRVQLLQLERRLLVFRLDPRVVRHQRRQRCLVHRRARRRGRSAGRGRDPGDSRGGGQVLRGRSNSKIATSIPLH